MNDDDLKRRFAELRRQDAKHVPPFAVARARRPHARVLFAVVPALAAAAALIMWCRPLPMAEPVAVESARPKRPRIQAAAALPLDFLLESAPARVRLDADPIEGLRP